MTLWTFDFMDLVIVESPTKARTISKFLGKGYKIESSFGHIRDLPKSKLGVDIENNFEPTYDVPERAKKTITNLKILSKKANTVILAADEDREGEAIAWHLIQALSIPKKKIKRIVFHEITKNAILEALKNPRDLNIDLVDAQQARRVLDRLVGYKLSPFLWQKVARGLSAGRVQSVAVRLVVEREREIQKFKIDEYWSIEAELNKIKPKVKFIARLNKVNNKIISKLEIKNKKQADNILADLKNKDYIVSDIIKKESKKNPPKPFTTSTLQQTANRWLGFSAKQTMTLAQRLYETGLITYMRTDSLNLSKTFLTDAKKYLTKNLGDEYALTSPRIFKTKSKGAQEAHEAIRPTDVNKKVETNGNASLLKLESGQARLYKLIWQRSLASQMPEAIADNTTIDIDAVDTNSNTSLKYQFRSTGQVLKFDGYLKIYPEKSAELILPQVEKNEKIDLIKLNPEQHFTKPPARYSDAGLVKELEKHGIGRPSTYAPTISTIETRNYVARDDNKRLAPTEIAFVVTDLLINHFSKVIDYQFTAKIEEDFDKIAHGKNKWQPVIREFYNPFSKNLKMKYDEVNKKDIMPDEETEEVCDKCESHMVIKTGRFGKFLSCSAYPDCKNAKPIPGTDKDKNGKDDNKEIEKLEKKYKNKVCDKCNSDMAIKIGKFGPFLACTAFPKCRNIKGIEEGQQSTGIKCPNCKKGDIIQKKSRRGIFYACNQYPECKTAYWGKPTGKKCECGALTIEGKNDKVRCSNKECKLK